MQLYPAWILFVVILVSMNLLFPAMGAKFNESCTSKIPCNSALGLTCTKDGFCSCLPYSHYYPETGRCSRKIGDRCGDSFQDSNTQSLATKECPPHAACISGLQDRLPVELRVIASEIDSRAQVPTKCTCDHNSTTITSKSFTEPCSLFLEYGKKCAKSDLQHLCNDKHGMICGKSDTCECGDGLHFDSNLGRCVMPVGGKIQTSKGYNICGKNAILLSQLEKLKYYYHTFVQQFRNYSPPQKSTTMLSDTCVCIGGFSNAKGQCVRSFGGTCSKNSECNLDESLACINGICQCDRGVMSKYFPGSGCRLIPGAKCSLTEGPKCIDETLCTDSECQCRKGYSATPGLPMYCLPDYGAQCNMSEGVYQCNHFTGLACVDGTCKCFDSSLSWTKLGCTAGYEGAQCGEIELTSSMDLGVDPMAYDFAEVLRSSQIGETDSNLHSSHGVYYTVGCPEGLYCYGTWSRSSRQTHCLKART